MNIFSCLHLLQILCRVKSKPFSSFGVFYGFWNIFKLLSVKNYYKIWHHRLMYNFPIVYGMLWDFESGLHNHRGSKCIILMYFKMRIVWRTRHIPLVKQKWQGKKKTPRALIVSTKKGVNRPFKNHMIHTEIKSLMKRTKTSHHQSNQWPFVQNLIQISVQLQKTEIKREALALPINIALKACISVVNVKKAFAYRMLRWSI